MADILNRPSSEAAHDASGFSHAGDFLTSKMPAVVKGRKWVEPGPDGYKDLSPAEVLDDSRQAEASLRKAVKQGYSNPDEVRKSINPSFMAEYGAFLTPAQNPALDQMAKQIQMLSAELGKNWTTASPLSTGFVPFDLVAPSKLIYPVYSPLRNRIPRVPGQGTSRRIKVVTGVAGSNTPSGSNGFQRISISELTNFSSWPGSLPAAGSATAVDLNISYKFFGISESLSWLAQFAGQGFEDISALANLIMLQEMMLNEEATLLAGTKTALLAPTAVTGTARSAGSTETAITGVTSNIYVRVTSTNFYGETTSTVSSGIAVSGGQVVDITITPGADGHQQFNVYVGTGTADPGVAATYSVKTGLGGVKYTIQGALPTSGTTAPTADTGTNGANDYEGMLSVLSGAAATNSVYPSGFKGGYINNNVGKQLSLTVLNTALQQMWDGTGAYRADPSELIVEGLDAKNLSADVATNGSGTNYQLMIQQNQMAGVIHGTAVSQVTNPVTRSLVNIMVHPWLTQGTAILNSLTLPQAFTNVSNVWENVMVQDYLSVAWPVIDPSFRYSTFMYGALVAQAPQYCGLLQGLQVSDTTPYS